MDAEQAVFIVPDDGTQIDVKIGSETVWLTPGQMADLFDRHHSVIRKHVRNVFDQGELAEEGNAQNLRISTGGRPDTAYSLDVIISVGYRVKSQRGVEFRQWATRTLKQQLIHQYRTRAQEAENVLAGLKNIQLLASGVTAEDKTDAAEVLALIEQYARSWQLLLEYDEDKLPQAPVQPTKKMARLTLRQATSAIDGFKKALAKKGQATELFGTDRGGDGLASLLGNLEQTWGGTPLYPNVETRAAHLLYFVIKNHPFLDGNKRIGSLLFLHYLNKNGRPLLEESALVALALLIAESAPKHKDIVVRLIISLMTVDGVTTVLAVPTA